MQKKKRLPRAVGYVRVSTAKDSQAMSPEHQRQNILAHAVQHGIEVIEIMSDTGISGQLDDRRRPGLAAAIGAIREGRAGILLINDSSRLSRNMDLTGYLRTVVSQAGGQVHVVGQPDDPMTRLFDAIKDQMYAMSVSAGAKRWRANRARRGLRTGHAPYGYTLEEGKLVPHPEETEVLRRILRLKKRMGCHRLAAKLNEEGIPTRRGGDWQAMTVWGIVKHEQERSTG